MICPMCSTTLQTEPLSAEMLHIRRELGVLEVVVAGDTTRLFFAPCCLDAIEHTLAVRAMRNHEFDLKPFPAPLKGFLTDDDARAYAKSHPNEPVVLPSRPDGTYTIFDDGHGQIT
jgi:hypothetical protein